MTWGGYIQGRGIYHPDQLRESPSVFLWSTPTRCCTWMWKSWSTRNHRVTRALVSFAFDIQCSGAITMGCSCPSLVCERTAPKPVPEALVYRIKGQLKSGEWRTGEDVRALFKVWNACSASDVQFTFSGCPLLVRSDRGLTIEN